MVETATDFRPCRSPNEQIMPPQQSSFSPRLALAVIMVALVLWAGYVAVGAYWYNMNPWRGVIVLATMAVFLGFWLLALWTQSRRGRTKP